MTPQQSTLNSFLDSQTLQSVSKGRTQQLHEVRDHFSKMTSEGQTLKAIMKPAKSTLLALARALTIATIETTQIHTCRCSLLHSSFTGYQMLIFFVFAC